MRRKREKKRRETRGRGGGVMRTGQPTVGGKESDLKERTKRSKKAALYDDR